MHTNIQDTQEQLTLTHVAGTQKVAYGKGGVNCLETQEDINSEASAMSQQKVCA